MCAQICQCVIIAIMIEDCDRGSSIRAARFPGRKIRCGTDIYFLHESQQDADIGCGQGEFIELEMPAE